MKNLAFWFNALLRMTALSVIFTVAAGVYFLYFEKPFLRYENIPFPPVGDKVVAGNTMPLTVRRCSTSKGMEIYTTTHSLYDVKNGQYYILPAVQVAVMPGCITATSMMNIIPFNTPAGTYIVIGTAEVRGTLKNHYVDWYSQQFEVVAPKAGGK